MRRITTFLFLILSACSNEVALREEGLITPDQVIVRCNNACAMPVGRCTMFNQESCVEECLNANHSTGPYTRQDIEYFEACIQCHIRQVCERKFAPDCFPDCLSFFVCPHGGCPYPEPDAGI